MFLVFSLPAAFFTTLDLSLHASVETLLYFDKLLIRFCSSVFIPFVCFKMNSWINDNLFLTMEFRVDVLYDLYVLWI